MSLIVPKSFLLAKYTDMFDDKGKDEDNKGTLEKTLDKIIFDHRKAAALRKHFAAYFNGSMTISTEIHDSCK